ncbi:DUF1800 family protein [Endozoicomonas sp. SCSIO W0465]|uniref:DUF1800 domain-containing protein n=1 Tax=Endozoicomonas sp. SCSIO W0465 TaxID=2918516 RepID=UPI002074EEC9|nr:DUF1800 domain-containing protein [Endozoicomonas sp. SCSIO W0465]USE37128.1 DUF1800 domain-containing protein [Endozoicomonas sp. SCSIO W0465]
MTNHLAVIATNRFGMGARDHEIKEALSDPQGWLSTHLIPPVLNNSLPDSSAVIKQHAAFRARKRAEQSGQKAGNQNAMTAPLRSAYFQFCSDTLIRSITSEHSFSWRLLDFFSNHFSVSDQGGLMTALAPTLEREAIAPNLFGSFADLLVAVEQHPAMLIYLDNEKSIGPDSRQANYLKKKSKNTRGMNENLAREILELHTMGVNGGYQLEDLQELAKAITGWSVALPKKAEGHGFLFREQTHQPGQRTVLGKTYPDTGASQGEAILRDLAIHPATARYVSWKLARHLINDQPPAALVDNMQEQWIKTGGNLKEVITVLIQDPRSWQIEQQKLKTPREFLVSVCRATDGLAPRKNNREQHSRMLVNALTAMGHKPFGAGSPAGFADVSSAWDGSDALLTRIDWTNRWVESLKKSIDPLALTDTILGAQMTGHSRTIISRAESRQQGLSLLLLSPEFMRR